jgi:Tfp pilus assembly protein PilV
MHLHNEKRKFQRGMSMLIALIALLILSITAVALVRSVDTGTLIIGNFAFKQDATEASSIGAERAITWLESQANLDNDDTTNGYYASSLDKFDPTGGITTAAKPLVLANWDGLGTCTTAKAGTFASCTIQPYPTAANANALAVNGNTVQWVITRLCQAQGAPGVANSCLSPGTSSSASANDKGELTAGGRINSTVQGPYYRIIVRSAGPRNTVSYTETMVHF